MTDLMAERRYWIEIAKLHDDVMVVVRNLNDAHEAGVISEQGLAGMLEAVHVYEEATTRMLRKTYGIREGK